MNVATMENSHSAAVLPSLAEADTVSLLSNK